MLASTPDARLRVKCMNWLHAKCCSCSHWSPPYSLWCHILTAPPPPYPSRTHAAAQPVLVVGNVSCVASAVWFGLAGSYWEAVAARVLGGALNAIILVEKAMIGEL